jgi:hypothetical protein
MNVLKGALVWSAATLISISVMAGGKTDLPTLTIKGSTSIDTKLSVDVLIEASDETGREFCQDTFRKFPGNSVYPHRYWISDVATDMSDSWGNYKTAKVTLNEVTFDYLEKKVTDGSLILPTHFDTAKYFERCGFMVKQVMIRDDKGSLFIIKDADYNNRPTSFVAVRASHSDGLFNLDYRWYDLDFTVDFK